jgi:hypothetical protein
MRIIVGVLTRNEITARREACLATWVRRLDESPDVTVVFLVGSEVDTPRLEGNVLHLPCRDDYDSLIYKVREFCRWALSQQFDYVFKCDDDTFVVVDRLLSFDPGGHDYIGIDPVDHVNPKFASGGAGYWLSRRAVETVAGMDVETTIRESSTNGEDYCVYWVLKDRFQFVNDLCFQAWRQAHRFPRSSNEIITVHYIEPPEMHRLDRYFEDLRLVKGYQGLDRGSNTRFASQFQLLQVDWQGSIGRSNGPIVLQESISVIGEGPHHLAKASGQPSFTYLRALDGIDNFRYVPLPYDLEYIPLVSSRDPAGRINKAAYVFSRKRHAVSDGVLFGIAPYRCNYTTRYLFAECTESVDCSPCGDMLLDKIKHLNQFKFAIACENLIADGYITEKLLDCIQADTVPIFVGGWLPEFLESCVIRLQDVSSPKIITAQLMTILSMSDSEYIEKLNRLRAVRFGHEYYEMFSYQSFFDAIGVDVDTTKVPFDGEYMT